MVEQDFPAFAKMLDTVYSMHSKSLNAEAKALFFRAMAQFPLPMVRAALDGHVRDPERGQYAPKPADLMAQIVGKAQCDGRPGADEAWAISLTSRDEAKTVVWTQEMAEAFEICRPVLEEGDEVGARMAFKDSYNRLVTEARRDGKPLTWNASLGWDLDSRQEALHLAVTRNQLPAPAVAALLPPPVTDDGYDTAKAAQQLTEIRKMLAQMGTASERRQRAKERAAQLQRNAERVKKRQIAEQVAAYQGNAE
ncbi:MULTISPECIES: hypothetical protein [unclassified Cupriavidus]|uniref:hypothetical protein n=1 Tax=unclassified Cupriavidus TaxID=2640874 RepID=UPI001BFFE363|nr:MULTISPECIES: hypothetical protein [unclassified Cupriavidus]MCA3188311.1 hypothetical protein [Cupriavidus sp.]MCA3189835.1 hypothetical protein [Cupriavidus sp.]MCA3196429.1 hypothetical protein [Cupriavidus sp.]MCA3202174.1 hypothetical protein [Cupriavidus sp.]MCA3234329.1 hypothetical protein [Cupriavidus sp.]